MKNAFFYFVILLVMIGATQAAMILTLPNGPNSNSSTTLTYSNLESGSATLVGNPEGTATLDENTVSGGSGSFTVTWTAVGDEPTLANPAVWSFPSPGILHSTTAGWGVTSTTDTGGGNQFESGEAFLLTFDLSNLTIDPGLKLLFRVISNDNESFRIFQRTGTNSGTNVCEAVSSTPAAWSSNVLVDGTPEFAIADAGWDSGVANRLLRFAVDIVDPTLDLTPPSPDPAIFSTVPYAIGADAIRMVAAIGSDESGPVEYRFMETTSDPDRIARDWDTSPNCTDTGLDPGTTYSYTVQLRDSEGNAGTASDPASATTDTVGIHAADLDYSGFIDIGDLSVLAGQWMDQSCTSIANMDSTCGVDDGDLAVLSSKWLNRQPNIVLLFIDDWAWNGSPVPMDDSEPKSSMPLLQMPNLERMAANGMKFRNAYAAAPQCAPSRVSLQTGMTTARTGYTLVTKAPDADGLDRSYVGLPVVPAGSDQGIDPDKTTIPEALKPHGYACAHFGKWHMYSSASAEGYIAHDGETTNNEGNEKIPGDPKRMFSITERAMNFMEEQVTAQRPFYVQISHYAMHAGDECLPETKAKYEAILGAYSQYADWYGMGEDLDGRIGAVLDKIEELGIADNTYVIMCGDNGYRHGHYDDISGMGQPLHSAKWWVWDGGLRVPMIAMGPDIPAGTVCTDNVIQYDFLPTFVEWAGGDPETEQPQVDGVSLASLMRGETPTIEFQNRNLYFHCPHYRSEIPASAIISGTDKLMYFYGTSLFMPAGFNPDMLFDLSTDKGEYHNLTSSNPTRAQELHDELFNHLLVDTDAWMPLDPNPDYDPQVWQDRIYDPGTGNPTNYYYWSPLPYVEGTVLGSRDPEADE